MIVAGSPGWLLSPAEMEQQKELMDGTRSNHGMEKRGARSPQWKRVQQQHQQRARDKILRFSTEKSKRIKNKEGIKH